MEVYIARWVHEYLTAPHRIHEVIADTPAYVEELLARFSTASHEQILRAHEIASEIISADRAARHLNAISIMEHASLVNDSNRTS